MAVNEKKVVPIYPFSDWKIIEEKFDIDNNCRNETIFAQGNGYIGMRGNFEEGLNSPCVNSVEGMYINGFYESELIKYPEAAFGYAERSQTMLNVANSKIIKLYVDGEEFSLLHGEVQEYKRVFDIKRGVLKRNVVWCSPAGKKIRVEAERLVSFKNKHLAAISFEVTPINFSGKIKIVSAIDGDVTNITASDDPRVGSGLHGRVLFVEEKEVKDHFGLLIQKTKNSGLTLACAMENQIETQCTYKHEVIEEELSVKVSYEFYGEEGKKIKLNKYIAYITSRDAKESELSYLVKDLVLGGREAGFNSIKKEQAEFLDAFWFKTDIEIQGDLSIQQGIRVNMFHLLQSAGRDGKTNIGAKGLTGEGYEGHYFWDTETYILPFFIYNNPLISRKLLEYRYGILDKARERARQMSHAKGALFPWRTIDGEECSAYYPAGTAQYHINADIALAIKRYMDATGDRDFLIHCGAEMLFETARFWVDLGDFIPHKGNKFCINAVTGPDEYTAIVNNNCYTNMMARENLLYAFDTAMHMEKEYPEEYLKIEAKIGLEKSEIESWRKAANNMYIPYDEETKIYLQDDAFLDRTPWDFKNTPPENYPLLMHYHPLVIYRHQVCKQADLVLAMFLLGEKFTREQKKVNYDFYEKITTHDSSLSTCIFSIAASEIGYSHKAYDYFMSTVRMDLDDYHGNTKDGIHAPNMAGAWMCVVNGFGGMRAHEGSLSFAPYLPQNWERYSFKITYKGRLLKVTVCKDGTSYELLEGEDLTIMSSGVAKFLHR